jgi:hypothetical protein
MGTKEPIVRCAECLRYVCRCAQIAAQQDSPEDDDGEPVDWTPWMTARAANA